MRTLVIGDIHGCYFELQALLDEAGLGEDDRILAVGDIVDRGPDTPSVIEFFRGSPGAESLMGNHERKHVRSFRGELKPSRSQVITREQLGEEQYPAACEYFDNMPRFRELDEAIVVHAGLEPGVALGEQRESVLVGTMSGERYLERTYGRPWYELYDGAKPVIVGHLDYQKDGQPLVYRDRVWAIDTGCFAGGRLTAVLLPEFRLISVPSRRDYWSELRKRYAHLPAPLEPHLARLWEEFAGGGLGDLKGMDWKTIEGVLEVADSEIEIPSGVGERLDELQAILAGAEEDVLRLIDHVEGEHRRIMEPLLARHPDFESMRSDEQGRVYSGYAGRTPLARFLHQARLGKLDEETLRQMLPTPREVARCVEELLPPE